MPKWVCVMIQQGEGCDYSIGCGQQTVVVEAETENAAIKAAIEKMYMQDYFSGEAKPTDYLPGGEHALRSWIIYQITSETDLLPLLKKASEIQQAKEKEASEILELQRDLAELERLKKKLGQK